MFETTNQIYITLINHRMLGQCVFALGSASRQIQKKAENMVEKLPRLHVKG